MGENSKMLRLFEVSLKTINGCRVWLFLGRTSDFRDANLNVPFYSNYTINNSRRSFIQGELVNAVEVKEGEFETDLKMKRINRNRLTTGECGE